VDFGGGLERILAAKNDNPDVFKTDFFEKTVANLEGYCGLAYDANLETTLTYRIVADHMRAAVFLLNAGVIPLNKMQGYVLRRLIRRSAIKLRLLKEGAENVLSKLVRDIVFVYQGSTYFDESDVFGFEQEIEKEVIKFSSTLSKGLKEVEKIERIDGKKAFDLYQTFGFPVEITAELFQKKGQDIDMTEFQKEFDSHKDLSRTASAGMFAGGLAGHSDVEVKYHTATHLLHQALRDVLGQTVFQKGSNITPERLRFDFSFDRKVTPEELKQVEEIVNQKIQADLKVERTYMTYDEAMAMNAIGLFGDKYDKSNVSIYAIGPNDPIDPESQDQRPRDGFYSLEFCGGPHVEHTNIVGGIKLVKEEAVSAGVRRIRAELI
jgi:alanyl-tRNA synthetase